MIKLTKSVGSLFPRAKSKLVLPLLAGLAVFQANQSQAAFIVEPHSSGKAFANFVGNPNTSAAGKAVGLTQTSSAFGSASGAHVYTYYYTPGVDADNTTLTPGQVIGTDLTATGATGGVSGTYNVYVTWVTQAAGSVNFEVTQNGDPVTLGPIAQPTGHPAVDKWWKIATVELEAGNTYSVTWTATGTEYVSMRSAGVMWELVPNTTEPCLDTPILAFHNVHGPLAAGQTVVEVSGLDPSATAVAVYKNGTTKIGELTSGLASGTARNQVPVEALEAGDFISATQTVNGQEGCIPNDGPIVGLGANSPIFVALSVRKVLTNAGPIGVSGGGAGSLYFIGANGGSLSTGPSDGVVLNPDGCWQTVTFDASTDPVAQWTGNADPLGTDGFVSLDGLAIKSLTGDTGPYVIYIDNLVNGETVVQDWEAHSVGQTRGFLQPSFSGSTTNFLLAQPDSAVVSDLNADTGFHSERITWQFKNTAAGNWLRLTTDGALPVSRPQLDLSQPITLRILVLPIGKTAADGQITAHPAGAQISPGANHTLTVTAEGSNNSYQWSKDGSPIPGATGSSYTITSATAADSGDYTVEVTNSTCTKVSTSKVATVTVLAVEPLITDITGAGTSSITITWEAVEGVTYRLQYKDDLNDPTWNDLPEVTATGTTASATDTTATGAARFYRVRVE